MLCLNEVELGGKFYFLRLLYFSWKRAKVCFPGLLFGSPQSLQESCYISIFVSKTLAWACHNRRRSLQVQYRANVLVASHAALWEKLWHTFKPGAKHGALTSRSRPYLTFVPCPTGCGMKNSPRRRAGRNRHFSCDIHFRESKVSRTHACHGCTLLTNISRC